MYIYVTLILLPKTLFCFEGQRNDGSIMSSNQSNDTKKDIRSFGFIFYQVSIYIRRYMLAAEKHQLACFTNYLFYQRDVKCPLMDASSYTNLYDSFWFFFACVSVTMHFPRLFYSPPSSWLMN
jgi:hypothetical protein